MASTSISGAAIQSRSSRAPRAVTVRSRCPSRLSRRSRLTAPTKRSSPAQVDGGKVAEAWSSSTMFRGMELVLRGRDPRDAWLFAQRI